MLARVSFIYSDLKVIDQRKLISVFLLEIFSFLKNFKYKILTSYEYDTACFFDSYKICFKTTTSYFCLNSYIVYYILNYVLSSMIASFIIDKG